MVVCIADDGSPHALYFTPPTNLFGLGKVGHMIPFFVGGILCCKYEWQKYIAGYWALGISAVMFLMWNILAVMPDPMNFFSISIGIIFSFSLCLNLARIFPMLFYSFRDYTFQIFLIGIFFQMVIRWWYVRLENEWLYLPLWVLSVVIGVYVPTLIARFLEKKASKGVRLCFGL